YPTRQGVSLEDGSTSDGSSVNALAVDEQGDENDEGDERGEGDQGGDEDGDEEKPASDLQDEGEYHDPEEYGEQLIDDECEEGVEGASVNRLHAARELRCNESAPNQQLAIAQRRMIPSCLSTQSGKPLKLQSYAIAQSAK
ncbi:hypothetical protein FRC06_001078, partial [Ceratobasidium sp. 370]